MSITPLLKQYGTVMNGSYLVAYFEYLKNGTSDDNHNTILEPCEPQNPMLEYENITIVCLLSKDMVLISLASILSAILDILKMVPLIIIITQYLNSLTAQNLICNMKTCP